MSKEHIKGPTMARESGTYAWLLCEGRGPGAMESVGHSYKVVEPHLVGGCRTWQKCLKAHVHHLTQKKSTEYSFVLGFSDSLFVALLCPTRL